jgi:hypothetical protein
MTTGEKGDPTRGTGAAKMADGALPDVGIKVLHYPGVRLLLDKTAHDRVAVGREVAGADIKADGELADCFGPARSLRHPDEGPAGGRNRVDPLAVRGPADRPHLSRQEALLATGPRQQQ